ncbi:MAG: hypothetical protein K5849_00965 [Bacteroidales bacterium]|nr:hypothetical protein [Bacteroidales bacterium]
MLRRWILPLLAFFACALPASAQFYTMGEDPGGLRWNTIETPTYRLVYPRGLDSLARVYAVTLEQVADPVGRSAGVRPNAAYGSKMPVILHMVTAHANGQVTWTPRRLELLTVPDPFDPEPTPWSLQLAVHESRHIAQMQFGNQKPFRWLNWLGGQLVPGGLAAIYCGPAFFEGDAVTAETALTAAGRGRSADFLEYYRVSFAAGDFRDYWRWRYGSQRWYTPDYYRAGYLAVGGIRAHYGVPDLTARYYQRIKDHGGVAFLNWDKTVREATGKSFREAFAEVSAGLQAYWEADDAARGPFIPSQPVSAVPSRFTEYSGLQAVGEDLYAIKSGITQPARLVRIAPDGREEPLSLLGASICGLQYNENAGRLFWSEIVRDVRWPMRSYSVIRSSDCRSSRLLTHKSRYFHPASSPDAPRISVTEYLEDGSSRAVVLDAEDGSVLASRKAPDGMQIVETVWVDGELCASAITDRGFGLYRVRDFHPLLAPVRVKIKDLWSYGNALYFSCDLTGVNELYRLDPATDAAPEQLTTTQFGGSDFEIARDTLFYASLQQEGRLVRKTALSDLQAQPADFSKMPRYPFAEELAAGEPQALDLTAPVEVSEPQPYSKLAHLFRFHSWLPLYFAFDSVDDLSLETLQQNAGLGATAFWQNDLGSGSGFVGYHAAYSEGSWRHSGHAKLSYTGLYPVIEAGLDFGDRDALCYYIEKDTEKNVIALKTRPRGDSSPVPSVSGHVRTYIPWNFSSGGWLRGVIPTATLILNNDLFEDGSPMHRTTFTLRGYTMQRTPESRVYPRFGIGAEIGYSFRWKSGLIAPGAFTYLYGYLPGLHETHGLRWSWMYAHRSDTGTFSETFVNAAPRGYSASVARYLASYSGQHRLALDYKLPLLPVDRAILGPVAYLRNFELTLHGDYNSFRSARENGSLFSAGADLVAVLGNLVWIPYVTRIGVSYNYNGGASYAAFAQKGLPVGRHDVSLVFSVEM